MSLYESLKRQRWLWIVLAAVVLATLIALPLFKTRPLSQQELLDYNSETSGSRAH